MRQDYQFVSLLLLFISGYQTQDPSTSTTLEPTTTLPDWYGDPAICTINIPTTPSSSPGQSMPIFTNQAEFTLERVIIRHRFAAGNSSELTLYHYIYDYDNNKLTLVENKNGTIDTQFYDYNMLTMTTYNYGEDTCVAAEIPPDDDTNGRSATQLENGTWHIRPMNEFLLFSSNVSNRQVTPVYLRTDVIRGIPVETWQSCYVNRARYLTEKRLWSFAQQGISMPGGVVGKFAIPVQAIVNGSVVNPDNTQRVEFDEVFNVLSYQTNLKVSPYQITPPRGVYCDQTPQQQLVSLEDVGIEWPFRFNVRVEATTSSSAQWQSFHLYYHQGDTETTSRLRYDYLPQGSEDYRSVIHDYTDNLTYTIDRQLGSCMINRSVAIPDVDPLVDPIHFFLKNEASFIFSPTEKAWENKGLRPCRTGSVQCAVLTTTVDNFPDIIEPDTGKPSGATWKITVIEYSWAMRSSNGYSSPNETKVFDYPVSLYLKMHRDGNPPPSVITADVEYEFYEISHDGNLNQFDTSICYRTLGYEYLHLVFILKLSRGDIIDGNQLNRRRLDDDVHYNLINRIQIRYSRITELELDHEVEGNDVTVFFTILGQTPNPESPSGFVDDEPTAEDARDTIQQIIDDGQFEFEIRLRDGSEVQFRAEQGSLKSSKQYMSTHAAGKKLTKESYTVGSQTLAGIVGSVVGLVVGILLAAIVRIVRNRPMPSLPSVLNPLPTVGVRPQQQQQQQSTEMTSEA